MNKLGGRYVLLEQLGAGAMGVVWRARDEVLHRDVAVKQLLLADVQPAEVDEACRRAMREARIAARLQHPHAVGVFDVVVEDGKPCLVMEFVPSRSLAAVLQERGPLPPVEVARIGAQVASALAAAHAAGIVHRDIKPANVLIGPEGVVKITDFGISRAAGDVAVTKTGLMAGTPAYLAPELARGADPGPGSDVFSLGATLYALMEGEPPFGTSTNDLGLLYKVASGQFNPPRRSGALTPLLTRLLANEPGARPTAAQAAEALDAVAKGAPAPVLPPSGPPVTRVMGATPPATGMRHPVGPPTPRPQPPLTARAQPVGPPTPPPRPPVEPEPEPAGGRGRGLTIAAVVLGVAVVAMVATLILNGRGKDTDLGNGGTTGPTTSVETPTQTNPPQTAKPNTAGPGAPSKPAYSSPPPSSAPANKKFTAADVEKFVRQHYAKLPDDPEAARQDWAPENRPGDYADNQYWGAYSKVDLKGDPEVLVNGSQFAVSLELAVTQKGATDVEVQQREMKLVAKGDKLLIVSDTES